MSDKIQIELYETKEGKIPFSIWLKSLKEVKRVPEFVSALIGLNGAILVIVSQ